jgi:purine-binding chemotaxis protein CheW
MAEKMSVRPLQFVSFLLHGARFGFDIRMVKEITPAVRITPVPLKVRDVSGVVNLRGQVVVVLDIGVSLGGPEQRVTEDSQIIILKTASEIEAVADFHPNFNVATIGLIPVGFLVDSIGDIVTVEASRIEAPPSHLPSQYRPYVEGIFRQDSVPLVILNAGAILGEAS